MGRKARQPEVKERPQGEPSPEAESYPGGVPPEWQVTVRRTTKEDGRYLIYYEFVPSAQAPETVLQPAEKPAEEQRR